MSPFNRMARRSFSPVRRRPARTFRTQWIGFAAGTGALPPDTTTIVPIQLAGPLVTNYGLNQPTVIRIRADLLVVLNDADITTAGAQANPWIGLAVLDLDDTTAGGNPDNPFDDADRNEWMLHRTVYLWSSTTADGRQAVTAAARFEVDVKSRRRIQVDQALAMVVTNPPITPSPGTVGVAITGRALWHEFGR